MVRIVTAALAALILATPLAALSQEVPSYALSAQGGPGDEQIRGRITSFDGAYALTVSDERGFVDNVDLHDGTIINPTGLTLAPGMVVSILGFNDGPAFSANEVDTPYSYDAGVPYYGGHRWDYYGPSISLGFFFGNAGWWHGNDFRGGYSYVGGARSYNEIRVRNVVRNDYAERNGESFRNARNAYAPREATRVDRDATPVQTRFSQPRSYEVPRQSEVRQSEVRQSEVQHSEVRQSGGHESVARESAPRGDAGHDRGGRPH